MYTAVIDSVTMKDVHTVSSTEIKLSQVLETQFYDRSSVHQHSSEDSTQLFKTAKSLYQMPKYTSLQQI